MTAAKQQGLSSLTNLRVIELGFTSVLSQRDEGP
jgi:hypothetical protein